MHIQVAVTETSSSASSAHARTYVYSGSCLSQARHGKLRPAFWLRRQKFSAQPTWRRAEGPVVARPPATQSQHVHGSVVSLQRPCPTVTAVAAAAVRLQLRSVKTQIHLQTWQLLLDPDDTSCRRSRSHPSERLLMRYLNTTPVLPWTVYKLFFFVQCQYFLDVGVWFLSPSPSNVPRQYYFDDFFALFCYALFYNHSQLCFCQSAISYTNDVTTMQYSLASLSTICKLLAPYESPVVITILHVHAIVV